jgi:hypothetical protein
MVEPKIEESICEPKIEESAVEDPLVDLPLKGEGEEPEAEALPSIQKVDSTPETAASLNQSSIADALTAITISSNHLTIMTEVFEVLEYFPNYSISHPSFHVKNNHTKKILKPCLNKEGYYQYCLQKEHKQYTIALHILIAMHFLGYDYEHKNGLEIDHIDRVTTNNSLDNLRIVTHSENNKNRNKYTKSSCKFVKELPEGEKYKFTYHNGVRITNEYYKVGDEVYKKIADNKYLWLAKETKNNSIHITVDNKSYKVTPNSKKLTIEKVEE